MVEFGPLFGKPGKLAAVAVDTLTTGAGGQGSYVISLTSSRFERMPAYAWSRPGLAARARLAFYWMMPQAMRAPRRPRPACRCNCRRRRAGPGPGP